MQKIIPAFVAGIEFYVHRGVRINVVSDFIIGNFAGKRTPFYNALWSAGGAMACKAAERLEGHGIEYPDEVVIIAKSLKDQLTEDQCMALIEHEVAHVINGDLNSDKKANKNNILADVEIEITADNTALKFCAAKDLIDALHCCFGMSIEKLIGVKASWFKKFVMFFASRQKDYRVRMANLKACV